MSRALLAGSAQGPALVLEEPLSMWGGLDPRSGTIIDRRHPQHGAVVTGTVLVLPHGRGSSSSSSVLAEAIRIGTAPTAVVLAEPDDIVLLGALAADEMYDIACPVVLAEPDEYRGIATGEVITIDAAGNLSSRSPQE